MGVNLVVIVEPMLNGSERRWSIGDRVDPDVIALEGFDEGFGDAVALGALDRGKAGDEVKRDRHADGVGGGVDGPVVGQPRCRSAWKIDPLGGDRRPKLTP